MIHILVCPAADATVRERWFAVWYSTGNTFNSSNSATARVHARTTDSTDDLFIRFMTTPPTHPLDMRRLQPTDRAEHTDDGAAPGLSTRVWVVCDFSCSPMAAAAEERFMGMATSGIDDDLDDYYERMVGRTIERKGGTEGADALGDQDGSQDGSQDGEDSMDEDAGQTNLRRWRCRWEASVQYQWEQPWRMWSHSTRPCDCGRVAYRARLVCSGN